MANKCETRGKPIPALSRLKQGFDSPEEQPAAMPVVVLEWM
jgi:hypothetical protein